MGKRLRTVDQVEVASAHLLQEPVQIVATDRAGASFTCWVHAGVLEGIPFFEAAGSFLGMLHGELPIVHHRVALPAGCGRAGLLALLRRLYSGRPWPVSVWEREGPAATEAAQLADMWCLREITQELKRAGCVVGNEPGGPSTKLPKHTVTEMLTGIMWVDRGCASRLQLAKKVLDGQLSLGDAHLDSLFAALSSEDVVERTGGQQFMRTVLRYSNSGRTEYVVYNYTAKLKSLEQFVWLFNMMIHRCVAAAPDRLPELARAVKRIRKDLNADIEAKNGEQKEHPDARTVDTRSLDVLRSCLTSVLDAGTDLLSSGDLSENVFDWLVVHCGRSANTSGRHLSNAREAAQVQLVEDVLKRGPITWFTPVRLSAFHPSAAVVATRALVAKLGSLDERLAEYVASILS